MDAFTANDSVLSLFDPLNTPPQSPARDAPSPDSWSDKENDGPSEQAGSFTAQFNRVYTRPEMAKVHSARLIDVASPSKVREPADHDLSDASDDEDTLQDISLLDCYASSMVEVQDTASQEQRMPLADIKLERVPPSEVAIPPTIDEELPELPASDHALLGSADSMSTLCTPISAAPFGAPLADIINSINLGFTSLKLDEPPAAVSTPTPPTSGENVEIDCMDITTESLISEFKTAMSAPVQLVVESTAAAPFTPPNIQPPPVFSAPIRRPREVTTSSADPRRISVDLYSTFSFQMQSPDMSFDLLNDKVSFLTQGQDSPWSGIDEDDTMDLAKEELKMKMVAERYEAIKEEEEITPLPEERIRCE